MRHTRLFLLPFFLSLLMTTACEETTTYLGSASAALQSLDYAVYSAVIKQTTDILAVSNALVNNKTMDSFFDCEDPQEVVDDLSKFEGTQWISNETLEDFVSRNSRVRQLTGPFPGSNVTLLSDTEIAKLSRNTRVYSLNYGVIEYEETYPNSYGIFDFSSVGFNEARTEAIVYVETYCQGEIFVLKKVDDNWNIVGQFMSWTC